MDADVTSEQAKGGKLVEAAHKVEHGIDTAKERIGSKIGTVKERLSSTYETAKEKAQKVTGKSMSEVADDVGNYVKEHPGQTILISFGVGAFLGWLFGRSR